MVSDFLLKTLAYLTMAVGGFAFFTCIVALLLAPFIVDKVDEHLAVLKRKEVLKPKGYPFSLHRMADYGLFILFKNNRFVRKKIFEGRDDRWAAVEDCPVWIKFVTVFVYASFLISVVMSFFFSGFVMVAYKYFG